MAGQNDLFTCPICFEAYTAAANPQDMRPFTICKNGHTLCSTCANRVDTCPTCREPKLLVLNRALLAVIEARDQTRSDSDVPEISADHVQQAARPFASGACADVYDAKWQNQSVVLKVLRPHISTAAALQDVLKEARLAMLLNHPNVVRVFGVVSIDGRKGQLMEKADRGSLRAALDAPAPDKLSFDQQVSISIDIVDGLDYIHSKQMVHRDVKPENVLLFDIRSRLTAKIADFGTSKIIQASLAETAMIGTPYYMAPELFETGAEYGREVDVYSVAIVLYEVFSGRNIRIEYERFENGMQLLTSVARGQRPEIPNSFPAELRTVIENGWSTNANARPTLAAFREALHKLKASGSTNAIGNPSGSPIIAGLMELARAVSLVSIISSRIADANVFAAFKAQLHTLEQSVKVYKLQDVRNQAEACRSSWTSLRDRTAADASASASTAQFHSLKGYVHHWFGECSDAYAETYQALIDLYEQCLLGTIVEGEQVVRILRYAVEVCWSQDQYAAAVVLLRHAVRYAKAKLSAEAYADVLDCFGYCRIFSKNVSKIKDYVLAARQMPAYQLASANVSHIKEAIAHYYLAQELYRKQLVFQDYHDYEAALDHLEVAQRLIRGVDADNIWTALCKSLEAKIILYNSSDEGMLEEAKQLQQEALGIAERILGEKNETVSSICLALALQLQNLQQFGDAEAMYRKAIRAAENSLNPKSMLVSDALECLADMYANQLSRYQEAADLYLRAVEINKSVHGPGYWELLRLYDSLEQAFAKRGQRNQTSTYSGLKSQVANGRLGDKFKSVEGALSELVKEVLVALHGGRSAVSDGNLTNVLSDFFKVAPNPNPNPPSL